MSGGEVDGGYSGIKHELLTEFLRGNPIETVIDVEEEPTLFKFFVRYKAQEAYFLEYDSLHSPQIDFDP